MLKATNTDYQAQLIYYPHQIRGRKGVALYARGSLGSWNLLDTVRYSPLFPDNWRS